MASQSIMQRKQRGSLTMAARLTILMLLALMLSISFLTGCSLLELLDPPEPVDSNPVQAFLDEHYRELEITARRHVRDLEPDSTVRLEAGDSELFYIFTFGSGPVADELSEFTHAFLAYPANRDMYESLAGDLADFMEIDALTITVKYYDSEGTYIASESFSNR